MRQLMEKFEIRDFAKLLVIIFLLGTMWARSEAHIGQLKENTSDIRNIIQLLNSEIRGAQQELTKIRYELIETRTELRFLKESVQDNRHATRKGN